MYGMQQVLSDELEKVLQEHGVEDTEAANMEAIVSGIVTGSVDEAADNLLAIIQREAFSGELKNRREERGQFEERLRNLWGRPFDLLELFLNLATETVTDFNSEYRAKAMSSEDYVFEALTRLHARACQTSWAILVLLRSGYADDAYARWRTLHEVNVVCSLISQHGQEVAERYLLHGVIQRYKLACEFRSYQDRINEEPITQEEFSSLRSDHDRLVCRFGKPFKEDYGWAACAIGSDRPTIRAIEEHVDLDQMRPYYKMASDNVHANSHGTFCRLGLSLPGDDVLLAGPSNAGLAEPGNKTAISLYRVTWTLLATKSNLDNYVVLKILNKMVKEIGEAFLQSQMKLVALVNEESDTEAKT